MPISRNWKPFDVMPGVPLVAVAVADEAAAPPAAPPESLERVERVDYSDHR